MKNISGTITAGGTAQVLTAQSANREYLFVQNLSAGDVWVNDQGDAALDSPSIQLMPGDTLELQGRAAGGAWSIIGATTAQKYVARED